MIPLYNDPWFTFQFADDRAAINVAFHASHHDLIV